MSILRQKKAALLPKKAQKSGFRALPADLVDELVQIAARLFQFLIRAEIVRVHLDEQRTVKAGVLQAAQTGLEVERAPPGEADVPRIVHVREVHVRDRALHVFDVHLVRVAREARLFYVQHAQKLRAAAADRRKDAGRVVQRPVHRFEAQFHAVLRARRRDLAEVCGEPAAVRRGGVFLQPRERVESVALRAENVRGAHRLVQDPERVRLGARVLRKELRLELRVQHVHRIDEEVSAARQKQPRELLFVFRKGRQKNFRTLYPQPVQHGERVLVHLAQEQTGSRNTRKHRKLSVEQVGQFVRRTLHQPALMVQRHDRKAVADLVAVEQHVAEHVLGHADLGKAGRAAEGGKLLRRPFGRRQRHGERRRDLLALELLRKRGDALVQMQRNERAQPHLHAVERNGLAPPQKVHFEEVRHVVLRAARGAGVARNDHRIPRDEQGAHQIVQPRDAPRADIRQGRDAAVQRVAHERHRVGVERLARQQRREFPVGEAAEFCEDVPHARARHDTGRVAQNIHIKKDVAHGVRVLGDLEPVSDERRHARGVAVHARGGREHAAGQPQTEGDVLRYVVERARPHGEHIVVPLLCTLFHGGARRLVGDGLAGGQHKAVRRNAAVGKLCRERVGIAAGVPVGEDEHARPRKPFSEHGVERRRGILRIDAVFTGQFDNGLHT